MRRDATTAVFCLYQDNPGRLMHRGWKVCCNVVLLFPEIVKPIVLTHRDCVLVIEIDDEVKPP